MKKLGPDDRICSALSKAIESEWAKETVKKLDKAKLRWFEIFLMKWRAGRRTLVKDVNANWNENYRTAKVTKRPLGLKPLSQMTMLWRRHWASSMARSSTTPSKQSMNC
jgi:hypothetical protein